MKKTRFGVSVSCLAAVVAFSSAATASAAETTLRWKFATGQKRAFVLTQKVVMAAEVQGRKVDTSFTQTTEMSWQIKGVANDGTADMVQTIDRIKFQMMAGGQPGSRYRRCAGRPWPHAGCLQAIPRDGRLAVHDESHSPRRISRLQRAAEARRGFQGRRTRRGHVR